MASTGQPRRATSAKPSPVAAALPISVFAIVAAVTKIVAGLLADRINQRALLIVAALAMTSAVVLGRMQALETMAAAQPPASAARELDEH